MQLRKGRLFALAFAASVAATGVVVAASVAGPSVDFTNVAAANAKVPGYDPPNVLSPMVKLKSRSW